MTFFALLWANPLARRALAIAAIVAVLLAGFLALRGHYLNQGKQQGQQQSAQVVKQETQQTVTAARAELVNKEDQHETKIQSLQKDLDNARSLERRANAAAVSARSERDEAQGKLAATKDADLHALIVRTLGKRSAEDLTPGFIPEEERGIAQCLVDRSGYTKENAGLSDQIQQLQVELKKLEGQQQEQKGKLDDLADYTKTVEHAYVEIYNAFPRKTNRLLWLVTAGRKGKEKTLPFPDPKVLLGHGVKENAK